MGGDVGASPFTSSSLHPALIRISPAKPSFSKTKARPLPKHLRCREKTLPNTSETGPKLCVAASGGWGWGGLLKWFPPVETRTKRELWLGCDGANIYPGVSAPLLKANSARSCSGAFIVPGMRPCKQERGFSARGSATSL